MLWVDPNAALPPLPRTLPFDVAAKALIMAASGGTVGITVRDLTMCQRVMSDLRALSATEAFGRFVGTMDTLRFPSKGGRIVVIVQSKVESNCYSGITFAHIFREWN